MRAMSDMYLVLNSWRMAASTIGKPVWPVQKARKWNSVSGVVDQGMLE